MKLSSILARSALGLTAVALIASGATAGRNLNSSKSNIYKLEAGNPDAEKQCIGKGGAVKDGMCVIPLPDGTPQPVEATTIKSSKSNINERTGDTPQPAAATKTICIIYQAGHEGDDRYCSQSVPTPK